MNFGAKCISAQKINVDEWGKQQDVMRTTQTYVVTVLKFSIDRNKQFAFE